MANLRKKVWISQLTKNFYPDSAFLSGDFSAWSRTKHQLTEAGIDPVC